MSVVLGSAGGEVLPPRPDDLDEACEGFRTGAGGGDWDRREVREALCERLAQGRGEGGKGGEGEGSGICWLLGEGGGL